MATSSARIFIGDDTTDGKSLIYKIKNKRPNIEGLVVDRGLVKSPPIDNYTLLSSSYE